MSKYALGAGYHGEKRRSQEAKNSRSQEFEKKTQNPTQAGRPVLLSNPMSSRTVYDVLEEAVQAYGEAPALQQPRGKNEYQTWTWPQYRDAAREIACGLRRFGVEKGDIVAVYCETRAEFYLADVGIMSAGAI